jgi:hypothetical protein
MQSDTSAHPASPTKHHRRRLLVLVDGLCPGGDDFRARWIAARAQAADVLLVAPALPVAGERWIIDLDARRARARANLASWVDALVDEAASVRGEIGDASPRLAVADALDGFGAGEYLDARRPAHRPPPPRPALERLRELFAPAPAASGLRARRA